MTFAAPSWPALLILAFYHSEKVTQTSNPQAPANHSNTSAVREALKNFVARVHSFLND